MNLTLQHVTTSQGIEIAATDAGGASIASIHLTPQDAERLIHILASSLQWWNDAAESLAQLATQTATEPSPANHEPE